MSVTRFATVLLGFLFVCGSVQAQTWNNHATADNSNVIKRHEAGAVVSGNKLYVMGGRGNRPNQVFDASQNKWSTLANSPMELHHFQPVVLNGYVYVIGAFTCCYPNESNVGDIYRLNLSSNTWETFGTIPANRQRGAAGAVAHNNKIYLVGGNTDGHSGGAVPWFDEYNPATGEWKTLPNAPKARDHFSAAIVDGKLVAAAGRVTNLSFGGMVAQTDVYNFSTNTWQSSTSIPTPRAGSMIGVEGGNLIVIGGETNTQVAAHDEVEAYDVAANQWRSLPELEVGRHGGAAGVINNILHVVTGNTVRGGGAEVTNHDTLNLSDADNDGRFDFEDNTNNNAPVDSDGDGLTDIEEQDLGTDPSKTDTDDDGLDDRAEINQHQSNPLRADTDGDGLSDSEELNSGTNLSNTDTDNDGLDDGEEVDEHQTDPLLSDTDADGLDDGEEITFGTNPLKEDSDGDALSDIDEIQTHNTNPVNADSDGDSLNDGDELQLFSTDPLLTDSDNDGLNDDAEVLIYNSNPNAWDTDSDGVSDATEASQGTNLINTDQDGDGILNTAEGSDDPDADSLANYIDLDSDNDGIPDIIENGRPDVDQNGLLDDGDATMDLYDADQDGIPNMLDLDSDQDGISDLVESGQIGTNTAGRFAADVFNDTNQNGWHNESISPLDTDNDATPDYLDLDSDDDGIPDVVENGQPDIDGNGILDTVTDANSDGFDDTMAAAEPTDTSEVPEETVTTSDTDEQTGSGGGGGAIASTIKDPALAMGLLLLSISYLRRRRTPVNP